MGGPRGRRQARDGGPGIVMRKGVRLRVPATQMRRGATTCLEQTPVGMLGGK